MNAAGRRRNETPVATPFLNQLLMYLGGSFSVEIGQRLSGH